MAAAGGARAALAAGAATRPFFYAAAGSTAAAAAVLPPAARAAANRMAAAIPRRSVPTARATFNFHHSAAAGFLSGAATGITRSSLLLSPPPPTREPAAFSALNGAAGAAAGAAAAPAAAAAAAECHIASSYSVHVPPALCSAACRAAAATSFEVRLSCLASFPSAPSSNTAIAARAAGAASSHALPPGTQHVNALLLPRAFGSSRFSSNIVQRAVRELPWGSREDLLRDRVAPVYVHEKRGTTPRREYNVNLLDGIRVRPTVNPFVKLNKAKRYVLDNWPSSLSARYKADVKKQYIMNGLPWVWEKDFYEGKLHFADRELLGPKRWYRRAFRRERVKEALRKMDDLVLNYRQEVRDRKRYDWFEKAVYDFAGEEIATQFIRKRVEPSF